MRTYLFLFLCVFGLIACKNNDKEKKTNAYNGPILESDDLNVILSDSGLVKVKVSTAKQLRYAQGDESYPKTVYVTFIDKMGVEYSRLRGDSARFSKSKNLYQIMGNVLVNNTKENQSLATEELFWNPSTRKIYSERKVNIKTPKQNFVALAGMDAEQDFSKYTLRKSRGTMLVDSIRTIVDTNVVQD